MSEIALLLNFIIAKAFYEKGLESKLRTSLSIIAESLYIENTNASEVIQIINSAFMEIHDNQFINYNHEIVIKPNQDDMTMDITIKNAAMLDKKLIKEMLKLNLRYLEKQGYEGALNY